MNKKYVIAFEFTSVTAELTVEAESADEAMQVFQKGDWGSHDGELEYQEYDVDFQSATAVRVKDIEKPSDA